MTLICKICFIKSTCRCNNINILMKCFKLLLLTDVVINIVIHIVYFTCLTYHYVNCLIWLVFIY